MSLCSVGFNHNIIYFYLWAITDQRSQITDISQKSYTPTILLTDCLDQLVSSIMESEMFQHESGAEDHCYRVCYVHSFHLHPCVTSTRFKYLKVRIKLASFFVQALKYINNKVRQVHQPDPISIYIFKGQNKK